MKILCPQHNGLIEVPTKTVADASIGLLKILVINCPVCEEEVLIQNTYLTEAQAGIEV